MWGLYNETPFAAERTLLRDGSGRELWTVAVKATFVVEPDGSCRAAVAQKPVLRVPRLAEAHGAPLLLEDADLTLPKPATDILVHGHAYAPLGIPTRELTVTVTVGSMRKSLLVIGDRIWEGNFQPTLSDPELFVRMPLTYERAFGGFDQRSNPPQHDARNPVGRGFVTKPIHAMGQLAPNIEYPQTRLVRAGQRPPPAGFGPISPSWSPRVEMAGTYDDAWLEHRHPLPPENLQQDFYCSAPRDQQIPGYLRGGEAVHLDHFTSEGAWKFSLPRIALGFSTHFDDGIRYHSATLATVELWPDAHEFTMTLITHLGCHGREHRLQGTVVTQKAIVPLGTLQRRMPS
jgi:hypothetical protein